MTRDRIREAVRPSFLALMLCLAAGASCTPEQGWDYRPTDTPMGWDGDDLIFFRSQGWGAYDMVTATCEGSGVFRLDPTGAVSPIRGDDTVCEMERPHRLSPDGRHLLATRYNVDETPVYSIVLVALESDSVWITRPDSGVQSIGSPVWTGSRGRWAYLSYSRDQPDMSELRVTTVSDSASRPLFQIRSGLRLEAWDSARQAFRFRRQSMDSTPSTVFEVDTLGGIVSERPVTQPEFPSPGGDRVAMIEIRNTFGRWKTTSDHALIIRDRVRGTETEVFASDPGAGTIDTGFGHVREGIPAGSVVWERDGEGVIFARFYRNGATLWRVGIDGTGLRQLTQHDLTAEPEMPSW